MILEAFFFIIEHLFSNRSIMSSLNLKNRFVESYREVLELLASEQTISSLCNVGLLS